MLRSPIYAVENSRASVESSVSTKYTRVTQTVDYLKLQPRLRESSSGQLAPMARPALAHLLRHPRLMEPKLFESLPFVIAGKDAANDGGKLLYVSGDTVYVKGLTADVASRVAIYRKFRRLIDPDSQEHLGDEIAYVGNAIVQQNGRISRLLIGQTVTPVAAFDRVLSPAELPIPLMVPHKSSQIITGKIIAGHDARTEIAAADSVVINRGSRDGVVSGQVYGVIQTREISDSSANVGDPQHYWLPAEIVGEIVIYKVEAKVSFGVVTNSTGPLGLNSLVQSQ